MATLSNESVCGASFNKFSLLQELSGTDADQSLEVLGSIVLFLVPGPILDKQPRKCDNETEGDPARVSNIFSGDILGQCQLFAVIS